MFVLIASINLHIPSAQSLKEKRSVVSSIVRRLDRIDGAGMAEVGHQDTWQRVELGATVVGDNATHVEQVMDSIERHIWSRTEVDVLDITRYWWEDD